MRTLIVAALLLLGTPALAQTSTATGNANSSSTSNSSASAGGGSAGAQATGGNSSVIFNTPGTTSSVIRTRQSGSVRTTPNAIAPGLGSAAVETCYGPGVSGGLSVTGFGAAFGAGQYDEECNLRLWARTAWAFGQKELAGALMAQSPAINRAMGILDQQRQPNGQVVYGARVRVVNTGAPGTASRGQMYAGCRKWSGGATGVGSCLY